MGARPLEPELEPIALGIINEPEVEDNMATDLRVGFKKRHRKRLHKAIEVVAPPAKRAWLEGVQEELVRDVPLIPVPPLDIIGLSGVPTIEKGVGPR